MQSDEELFEISELYTRFFDLVHFGVVTETSPDLLAARVRIRGEETGFLPFLFPVEGEEFEVWDRGTGARVVVLSPAGNLSHGVILGAIPKKGKTKLPERDVRRTTYSDGTSVSYDRKSHKLQVKLSAEKGAEAEVSAGSLTIRVSEKGELTVTGATSVAVEAEEAKVEVRGNALIEARKVEVKSGEIQLGDGQGGGVVTQKCVCALTGAPHPQGSQVVLAGILKVPA